MNETNLNSPQVEDGWKPGATYLTQSGVEVRIIEICNWKNPANGEDIKAVIVKTIEHNESAGYDINGNPLTSSARELGVLQNRTSGIEKRR